LKKCTQHNGLVAPFVTGRINQRYRAIRLFQFSSGAASLSQFLSIGALCTGGSLCRPVRLGLINVLVAFILDSIFGGNVLNRLRFPSGSLSDACQPSAPHKSGWPPTPTLNKLTTPLILELPKKIYDLAPPKFMTLRSKKNQDPVNLCFRLIALPSRGVVEKSLGDRNLSVELPKRVYIRRFGIHSLFSNHFVLTALCRCPCLCVIQEK
jgi:hypothetical protein